MCGRFASARKRQELLAEFQVERDRVAEPLAPDYNVAPTKQVYAVLTRGRRGAVTGEQDVARELRVLRWGLVPSWAKNPSIGSRLINARAETVDSRPAFRHAFARRRCLLPADGFYEWQRPEGPGGRKQPYYIHRRDGGVLAFAGLYELWRDAGYPDDHPSAWLWTATIITTSARDGVGRIHDRMPMVIEPAWWADWLDPGTTDVASLRPLLEPALTGGLASDPVSTEVNSVRNNGARLIEPVPDSRVAPFTARAAGGGDIQASREEGAANGGAHGATGVPPAHRAGSRPTAIHPWPARLPRGAGGGTAGPVGSPPPTLF